jgi:hypothetical protein
MRKWKVLAAVLAVAFVAPVTFAQTQEDIFKEVQEMKARLAAVEAENAALKAKVANQDDQSLESQINALTERFASTTVKSNANPITLSGEFRFRSSWSFGDSRVSFVPDGGPTSATSEHDGSWTDSMVRLGFLYDITGTVTAFAELQSHWAFGDESSTDNSTGFGETTTDVELHQGWVEIRNIFNRSEFSSRTGRQEIVLGNQFHFGNADWFNGWAFDATRWDWDSKDSFSITAIAAKLDSGDRDFNQVSSFSNTHDDDELYSVYFTLKTIKDHALDLYWIYINGHGGAFDGGSGISFGSLGNSVGDPATFGTFTAGTAYYHTIGARIGGVFKDIAAGLDWNLEGCYQFGDQNLIGGGELDIGAFAFEAELGITFSRDSKFRIYARGLWADGPDNDELGFIPLYPNRHSNGGFRARYGQFDLIPMTNVLTLQLGLHFDPDPAWTLGITGLWATAEEGAAGNNILAPIFTGIPPTPLASNIPDEDYGWEIDGWVEYRYNDHLFFNVGVAFVFADDALESLWGIDDDMQFLGYIQGRLLF